MTVSHALAPAANLAPGSWPSVTPKGVRYGGRAKGTPNRAIKEVMDKLAALNCDHIEGMARIALDESNPVELRAQGRLARPRRPHELNEVDAPHGMATLSLLTAQRTL